MRLSNPHCLISLRPRHLLQPQMRRTSHHLLRHLRALLLLVGVVLRALQVATVRVLRMPVDGTSLIKNILRTTDSMMGCNKFRGTTINSSITSKMGTVAAASSNREDPNLITSTTGEGVNSTILAMMGIVEAEEAVETNGTREAMEIKTIANSEDLEIITTMQAVEDEVVEVGISEEDEADSGIITLASRIINVAEEEEVVGTEIDSTRIMITWTTTSPETWIMGTGEEEEGEDRIIIKLVTWTLMGRITRTTITIGTWTTMVEEEEVLITTTVI